MTPSPWHNTSLGILGAGNMAEAIVKGILNANLLTPQAITVHDIVPERRDLFAAFGCTASENPQDALPADVVLLATKPQNAADALKNAALRPDQLLVSIAAGVPTAALEKLLPPGSHVIRVMPNTPLLVGKGMSALTPGTHATPDDMRLALALFQCAGEAVEVPENLMDAVTALSGSGPAYLFAFAESLAQAAQSLGMDPDLAARLTAGTLLGSAEMLSRMGNPGRLRQQVTSPGGTTAAALAVFEKENFPRIVQDALTAARDRSSELGRAT